MEIDERLRLLATSSTPQSAETCWTEVVAMVRSQGVPESDCRRAWEHCFAQWPESRGPRPVWFPSVEQRSTANVTRFILNHGSAGQVCDLPGLRRWANEHPVAFWEAVFCTLGVEFQRQPTVWLDNQHGLANAVWGRGGALNIAVQCLPELAGDPKVEISIDREGGDVPGERSVLVWQTRDGQSFRITARELAVQVRHMAAALEACGWSGQRVAMIMPMNPISVALYLAILYRGGTVISIADSFSASEIRNRLRLAQAEWVVTCEGLVRGDKLLPLLPRVHEATALPCLVVGSQLDLIREDSGPWRCSVPDGCRPSDVDWNRWIESGLGSPCPAPAEVDLESTVHLLFSSGTTGDPKVIPWTPLTPLKCAADGFFHQNIQRDDVVAWPTNWGWMMGPWLVYATLLNRATMALYEDAPLGEGFGRFVEAQKVTVLGLVPSMVKAWRASRVMEACDWSAIRVFSSTGESSQKEDYFYLSWLAGFKPIIEYCGGTEIGGGYISSTVIEPNAPATFTGPAIGLDFEIRDEQGGLADEGELWIVPPSVGLSQSLLNRDHFETYYADTPRGERDRVLRRHGDYFRRLPGGYYEAGGRTDDTMNLGGIKVSSLELERVINAVPGVSESAAIACSTEGGPESLVVFLVTVGESSVAAQTWRERLNLALREQLNPLFKVWDVQLIPALPRTASNKILRRDLRQKWQADRAADPPK